MYDYGCCRRKEIFKVYYFIRLCGGDTQREQQLSFKLKKYNAGLMPICFLFLNKIFLVAYCLFLFNLQAINWKAQTVLWFLIKCIFRHYLVSLTATGEIFHYHFIWNGCKPPLNCTHNILQNWEDRIELWKYHFHWTSSKNEWGYFWGFILFIHSFFAVVFSSSWSFIAGVMFNQKINI